MRINITVPDSRCPHYKIKVWVGTRMFVSEENFDSMKAAEEAREEMRADHAIGHSSNISKDHSFVVQDWVQTLTFMQQSVLLTSIRGPDGMKKDHVSKLLIRWLRRCILISALDRKIFTDPHEEGGGSFTGPMPEGLDVMQVLDDYLRHVDEIPHHFQLHFMHAAEILGYKHPEPHIRVGWKRIYHRLVNDMHLYPEPEEAMDKRLGDNRKNWLEAEEVTARFSS